MRVNHVAVVTRDLERLAAFYAEVLGAEPAYERSERDEAMGLGFLRVGEVVLHVFERPGDSPGGVDDARAGAPLARGRVDHVAFEADGPEQFVAVRERLLARGATDGAVVDFGVLVSVFGVDPDGSQVEVCLVPPAGWEPPFPLAPPPGRW